MSAYGVHQYLWGGFSKEKRDFLFQMTDHDQGVLLAHDPCELSGVEPYTVDPLEQGEFNYMLTANPVFRDAKTRSHKLITSIDEQRAWLQRKLGESCEILTFYAVPAEKVKFRQATIQQVHMFGCLTIKDPDALKQIITSGIGRGKAFGCGLLLLNKEIL